MKKYSSDYCSRICSKKTIIIVCLIGFTVAFSCTSALYIPSVNHVTPHASLSELQSGRKQYIRKCAGCHTLYLPEKYSKEQWVYWVDKMDSKVKMDSIEKDEILKYVNHGKYGR
ncbi:MAG: hypothetical protein Q8M08_07695 [Bacteroidales bacterium]|nr:hypothetical protein [Bacteroidales bacterium]